MLNMGAFFDYVCRERYLKLLSVDFTFISIKNLSLKKYLYCPLVFKQILKGKGASEGGGDIKFGTKLQLPDI